MSSSHSQRPTGRSGRPSKPGSLRPSRPVNDPAQSIPPGEVRKRVTVATACLVLFATLLIATFVRNCIYGFGSAPFESAPPVKRAPALQTAPAQPHVD